MEEKETADKSEDNSAVWFQRHQKENKWGYRLADS